jgi:hypothetical protein
LIVRFCPKLFDPIWVFCGNYWENFPDYF